MVKIGVLSDTHIGRFADLPGGMVGAFADVDLILHAGDLANLDVLEGLRKIGPRVYAVWGNMDPPDVRRSLPEKEIIQIGRFRIGLTHGSGAPFNLIQTVRKTFKYQKLDCIVYGHSHSPQNKMHRGLLYFNPGSPTDKVYAPYNSYGLLEIDQKLTGTIVKISEGKR